MWLHKISSFNPAYIQRHEGRSWYTAHRGRLWIAATAKPVDMEEVKRMENFYRVIYKGKNKRRTLIHIYFCRMLG